MGLDIKLIRYEFLNLLRQSDIISVSERGLATITDSFTATGGSEVYTLTNSNTKDVKEVKVNSNTISFGSDYVFNYNAPNNIDAVSVLLILNAGDIVEITYDYGNGDSIYPDFGKAIVTLNKYPRMGFGFIDAPTEVLAVNGVYTTSFRIQIDIWDKNKNNLDNRISQLRTLIKNNTTSLYYSNVLRIVGQRDTDYTDESGKTKIYKCSLDIMNELNIER